MKKILEMRNKRMQLITQARGILDKAYEEKREMTGEETTTYENINKEIDSLGSTIEREERQAKLENDLKETLYSENPAKKQQGETQEMRTGRATEEYRQAFLGYLKGEKSVQEIRSLHKHTDTDKGAALVPEDYERTLIDNLVNYNVIRGLATVLTSTGDKIIPFVKEKGEASWIDEEGLFQESDDKFDKTTMSAYKVGTIMKVSTELMEDSVFNLESYINNEFGRRIGAKEEEAYTDGDGTGKPLGFIRTALVGVNALSATAITTDEIIDLYYSVPRQFRANATWLMNEDTIKVIRKLKNAMGDYIWQPGLQGGQPDRILTRPIATSEYTNSIVASKKPIAFGDFRQYRILDRAGIFFQTLRELYATTGQIGFLAYRRTDGKLLDASAIKVLKMKD